MNLTSKTKKGISLPLLENGSYHLSIQVRLDGFSFCVFDIKKAKFVCLEDYIHDTKNNRLDFITELQSIIYLDNLNFKNITFETIDILFANDLYTLVPKELHESCLSKTYLKLNVNILKNNAFKKDLVKQINAFNIYAYSSNPINYFKSKCNNTVIKHFYTYFIDQTHLIHKENSNKYPTCIYVYVFQNLFYITILQGSTMILCNHFCYQNNEDFIYYILFVYKQLYLQTSKIPIILFGNIKEDSERFEILKNYIQFVNINKTTDRFNCNFYLDVFSNQRYYSLLNQSRLI